MVFPSTSETRPSLLPMLLVAALSAVVVAGVYEVRARLARHSPEHASAHEAREQPAARAETQATSPPESCTDLRRSYLARCTKESSIVRLPVQPPPPPQSVATESEARAAAELAAWVRPSPSVLGEMAARCEVRLEMPSIIEDQPPTVSDDASAALSLSARERAVLQQTLNQMHAGLRDFVGDAFRATTGSSAGISGMTFEDMLTELQSRPESGFDEARERLAQERAGLVPPPDQGANQPAGERLLRLWAGMGDEFERRLASEVGGDRAHEMRFSPRAAWMNRLSQSGCRSSP